MMKSLFKKMTLGTAVALIAYFILFHTPWIISYTSTYKQWYRNFLCIEAGQPYDADSIISFQNSPAIIRDYIRMYQMQLFDRLFWNGKIRPEQVKDFQALVTKNGDDLLIVNISPLMELPDGYEEQWWIKRVDAIRSGDRSAPPEERALVEFTMLNFQRIVFRNPYNKISNTNDAVVEIKHLP